MLPAITPQLLPPLYLGHLLGSLVSLRASSACASYLPDRVCLVQWGGHFLFSLPQFITSSHLIFLYHVPGKALVNLFESSGLLNCSHLPATPARASVLAPITIPHLHSLPSTRSPSLSSALLFCNPITLVSPLPAARVRLLSAFCCFQRRNLAPFRARELPSSLRHVSPYRARSARLGVFADIATVGFGPTPHVPADADTLVTALQSPRSCVRPPSPLRT